MDALDLPFNRVIVFEEELLDTFSPCPLQITTIPGLLENFQ